MLAKHFFCSCLLLTICFHKSAAVTTPSGPESDIKLYNLSIGNVGSRTYMFTNLHWWESSDHQITTIVTLLALAQNTSSIAVIPPFPVSHQSPNRNKSLIGDFFDIAGIKQVQPAITFADFLELEEYKQLKAEAAGSIPLPKGSQEEYESRLGIYGQLQDSMISLSMPKVDPENTNQLCNHFGGTIHISSDKRTRFVFLEKIHFLHFCAEKFMPWWYTIRQRISPRKPYHEIAEKYLSGKRTPFVVVHLNDVLEQQKDRGGEEIEKYARQIVDALRKNQAIRGTLYIITAEKGENAKKVVNLLKGEFESIHDCKQMFNCISGVSKDMLSSKLSTDEFGNLFMSEYAMKMTEWALSSKADLFIGNVHSPYSKNICLYRKIHGRAYSILRGFGEVRKIWAWNLMR